MSLDKANIVIPPGKDIITRLDRDVLDYLRAQGKGYQTLINQSCALGTTPSSAGATRKDRPVFSRFSRKNNR